MANQEHLDLLLQGVDIWNQWRQQQTDTMIDLSYASLNKANLNKANLSGVYSGYSAPSKVNLTGADLSGADLSNADLSHAFLDATNFSGADLSDADLSHAFLCKANLSRANLSRANLAGAWLREPDLLVEDSSGGDLSDANLVEVKLYGAEIWMVNLSGSNLSRAKIGNAHLVGSDLSRANFSGADFSEAKLGGNNFSHTDLSHADLNNTDLSGANLSHANLVGANLVGANLTGAYLSGASLNEARVGRTHFDALDLRETRGLAEIQHAGPSNVQLHTVQLPQDGSAIHFLRGAGVPDEYINLWRTTMMYPIQYHSLFISYSSKDEMLAHRLHEDLQAHGVRCWFAPEDMKIGDEIRSRIDEAIHLQEKLLLLLSEHSLASTWVKNEVEAAFEKEEKQQRLVLFPIRLDESVEQTTKSWAATLRRTRHIGDFTHWTNPQAYRRAFERLLRDLRAESNTKGEADGKPGAS